MSQLKNVVAERLQETSKTFFFSFMQAGVRASLFPSLLANKGLQQAAWPIVLTLQQWLQID